MTNPFKIYWAQEWTFQIVHMEGGTHIEGYGLGLCLRAPLAPGENPLIAADQLICREKKSKKLLISTQEIIENN